ncbi:MAG: beta-ketoacyl-ACP synthase [Synechocystis sp.]
MTAVVVTGISLQTCLGPGQQTWQRICAGETGIQQRQPFPELESFPLGLIHDRPQDFSQLVPGLLHAALQDAQLTPSDADPWGVVIGSSRGCQNHWEDWVTDQNPSVPWLETFPYQAANLTAQLLPQVNIIKAPMAACATGLWAIAEGTALIRQGQCQRVIAGAVEVPITPLTLAGFERMGALAQTGCFPFDGDRQGLALAEGGAFLVLESLQQAQQRRAQIYGRILDWGFSCDAHDRSAPAADNHSAKVAIKNCLDRSGLFPDQVDFIHPHGTGTVLNDQREAQLIQDLFPASIPITTSKGATGHTLGASGAIAVALSLLSLHHQRLPPCVGLRNSPFPLNFVGLRAETPLKFPLRTALCLSFGFGGQNAAIALAR